MKSIAAIVIFALLLVAFAIYTLKLYDIFKF